MPPKSEIQPQKPIVKDEQETIDNTLRPSTWNDYVGQEKTKKHLRLIIDAARERKESCDHILFHGQAGLGKTTLAYIISNELKTNIRTTSGPALEKTGDVAAILSNLEPYEILFIDEIHRMNKLVEEILYPALESRKLHLIIGKGAGARTLTIDLPPFTMIAATTKMNLLSSPLRSRFGATFKLDYYTAEDIERILERSAKILNVTVAPQAIAKLALASRFTPRTANRLLKRARDYAQIHPVRSKTSLMSADLLKANRTSNGVNKQMLIDEGVVDDTLNMLEVDHLGLEETDRRLLETIIKKFNGGPVGVKTIAASLSEDPSIIEDVYEPFLMTIGLLHRSPMGRIATPAAYEHLNLSNENKKLV